MKPKNNYIAKTKLENAIIELKKIRESDLDLSQSTKEKFTHTTQILTSQKVAGLFHKVSLEEICEEKIERRKSKRFLSNKSFDDKGKEVETYFGMKDPQKDQLYSESEV